MANLTRKTSSNLRHPTRLACGLIPLLNMLQDHGVDIQDILKPMGIRKFEFIDPAFTITLEQELAIANKALEYLHCANPGLELAKYYHLHNFSVLGLAIRSCATLADIFELIRCYPRLQWGICKTTGSVVDNNIVFELEAGDTRAERFLLERDMACIKTVFGEAIDGDLHLNEVGFAYAAPADTGAFEQVFQCPVLFDQKTTYLSLPLSELEKTVPTADPLSKEFYEAQCARISAEMDEPFRYTWLVRDHLSRITPIPSLEELSARLDIEPRTLQRLLKKEAETFGAILQEVRLKRATDRLLYSSMSAEQIAQELGFNDAVAFSHAFKLWTGVSPRQWRTGQVKSEL